MRTGNQTVAALAPIVSLCILAGLGAQPAVAATINVPGDQPTIQEGINAAVTGVDEVVVADGTYTGTLNKNLDLGGKAITVRSASGDPALCVIDCENSGRGFIFQNGETAASVVDGFTITNGNVSGSFPDDSGGGIYCEYSSPTITNCTITNNTASGYGGGIYFEEGSPTVTNCTITSNTAGSDAGGVYFDYGDPTITNCTITGNTASGYGGGIACYENSATITDCTITDNTSYVGGGVSYEYGLPASTTSNCTITDNTAEYGGGVYSEYGDPTITDCTFTNNVADGPNDATGGGISSYDGSPTITGCSFAGNSVPSGWGGGGIFSQDGSPVITNCTFTQNIAADEGGGGIYFTRSSGSYSPTVTNCLFTGNSGTEAGGAILSEWDVSTTITNCTFTENRTQFGRGAVDNYYGNGSNITIINCIFWGNTQWDDITPWEIGGASTVVTYTNVRGGWTGTGNIDADPLFVDAGAGDYQLGSGSPGIDAGDNAGVPGGVTTDLAGNPRFVDDAGTTDSGNGTAPIVDMGAYEVQLPVCVLTVYVNDATGNDANDGDTPGTAKKTIQAGIDAACNGGIIIVADGTYTGIGNKFIDFFGRALTVRSADGPANCIIDCEGSGIAVDFENNETDTSILDGFTITGADDSAIYCYESSPTITNCTITGNTIYGGIYCDYSSPTITDCTITGNISDDYGGGIYCYESSPAITGCTIENNTAAEYGGGVYLEYSNPTITNCSIIGNMTPANWYGGGLYGYESNPAIADCTITGNEAEYGGGVAFESCTSPTITNCTFTTNTAGEVGGGVYCVDGSDPAIVNCTFTGNLADGEGGGAIYCEDSSPAIANCTITGNTGAFGGGGIYGSTADPTITSCVIAGNDVPGGRGGGLYFEGGSDPTITNCAITGNTSSYDTGGGVGLVGSTATISNCTFSGNTPGGLSSGGAGSGGIVMLTNCILWGDTLPEISVAPGTVIPVEATYSDVEGGWTGTGNIAVDPLFVDAGTDDYHLGTSSPCSDAGNNAAVPGGVITDLDGFWRFVDDLDTVDTGAGTAPIVDIGAYEFHCDGDSNGDGEVNPLDSGYILARFGCPVGTGDPGCDVADVNGDGEVNPLDSGFVLARYGQCM